MKGLLLKDFYMTVKYCRSYLFIMALFIVLSAFLKGNFFFVFYPCLFSGMIPVALLGYDERSGWEKYSGALPYTKEQIVSSKYIIGLAAAAAVTVLSAIAQAVRMSRSGGVDVSVYLAVISALIFTNCVTASVSLPFMFKLGVEKGRLAYFLMIGLICIFSVISSAVTAIAPEKVMLSGYVTAAFIAAGIAIYVISWRMSIVFYKKREIS